MNRMDTIINLLTEIRDGLKEGKHINPIIKEETVVGANRDVRHIYGSVPCENFLQKDGFTFDPDKVNCPSCLRGFGL